GVSILYITHDIASARYVADRLIVMYAGQIAETGSVDEVLARPRHPYTQLLLSAVPDPRQPLRADGGAPPGPPPPGVAPRPRPRLPVPRALPAGHRHLPHRDPPAHRPAAGPRGGLPRGRGRRPDEGVRMKIAVVGGASTYTPELIDGIGRLAGEIKISEIVL